MLLSSAKVYVLLFSYCICYFSIVSILQAFSLTLGSSFVLEKRRKSCQWVNLTSAVELEIENQLSIPVVLTINPNWRMEITIQSQKLRSTTPGSERQGFKRKVRTNKRASKRPFNLQFSTNKKSEVWETSHAV